MNIFETQVIAIGEDAEDFKQEDMLLLFGEDAPPELSDFCYKILIKPIQQSITSGMKIWFNENAYKITAVGEVAEENLRNLGHITINFNGATTCDMPGTIYVERRDLPNLKVGDTISIKM
ncbi:PTS glucitol/sorbitol transporter subunit IIA [Candidatus Enterococcus ferrettii]|uniref:PTS system, glucitol/sorbitol-specific IIA component n=1 Tax=Candidatus Enterococcus ferrettii TaxID=2815324 RepID=A0ABV0EQF3_9ENTE|nr:PTS glucitol/sorbitol transporter subunit IIA [Enterococcus sp. 665A]MBO1338184.1 PTS glucitol/sorbitol transporter subunit IIA [Enterococcus sp. 665A]